MLQFLGILLIVSNGINGVAFTKYLKSYTKRSPVMMTGRSVGAWLDCLNVPIPSRSNIFCDVPVDCILAKNGVVHNGEDSIDMSQTTELFNNMGKIFDKQSRAIGAIIEVDSGSDQNAALSLIGSVEWIALRCTGKWTMIPVENLISACDGTGTKLAVFVDSVENLPGVLFALQLGPHAVILGPKPELWESFRILKGQNSVKEGKSGKNLKRLDRSEDFIPNRLQKAVISGISSGCIGDRVCIDLIQLLKEGEGLLIGSNVKLLALVHGETFEGEFVPSRPFRVNAGLHFCFIFMYTYVCICIYMMSVFVCI
jgi:3-dehydroquinate synthase class II